MRCRNSADFRQSVRANRPRVDGEGFLHSVVALVSGREGSKAAEPRRVAVASREGLSVFKSASVVNYHGRFVEYRFNYAMGVGEDADLIYK